MKRELSIGALAVCALLGTAAAAQQVKATTLPLREGDTDNWFFHNSLAIGVHSTSGILKLGAKVNIFSLAEPRFLFRGEFETGHRSLDADLKAYFLRTGLLLLGNGPLHAIDVQAQRSRWALMCDSRTGFVALSRATSIGDDRVLLVGARKCHGKDIGKVMEEPWIHLVNIGSGQLLWSHETKALEVEVQGGYWARVARFQGAGKTTVSQILALPYGKVGGAYRQTSSAEADRVIVIGQRLEALNIATGAVLWRTREKVGEFEAAFGNLVFTRDGDELSAHDVGTGALAWTMDLNSKGARLYSADDLVEEGDLAPFGPEAFMVSEGKVVSLVEAATGRKKWTVRRDDADWQATPAALLVAEDDRLIAYDWTTGARRWEMKASRRLRAYGFDRPGVALLVDRGKFGDGEYTGPFRFWGVDLATGTVAWTRTDLDGKRIADFDVAYPGQVRVTSEAGRVANLNIADGSAATAPAGAEDARFVVYSAKGKVLRAFNYAGDVVWERQGERSPARDGGFKVGGGVVVWLARSGTVEAIALRDGTSLWKAEVRGHPRAYMDDDGRYVVVPHERSVEILQIVPATVGSRP